MRLDKNTAAILVTLLGEVDTRDIALDCYMNKPQAIAFFNYVEQLIDTLAEYSKDKRVTLGLTLPERIERAHKQLNREKSTTRGGRRYYSEPQQEQEIEGESKSLIDLW